MATSFKGSVVWVTGGGTGIGRAVAHEFARRGARVAVSGRRLQPLTTVVAELEAHGAQALAVTCDVTDEATLAAAVQRIIATWGRLDVAVANAGFGVSGLVEDLSREDWLRQLETNVIGLGLTARHALPELRKTRGRLGLVGSVSSYLASPRGGLYTMSKFAVRALSDTLYLELKGSGVSCTGLHPGFVESDIGKTDNQGVFHPDRKDPRPAALMWTAEAAAKAIVGGLAQRRRELVFTGHGRLAVALVQHFPGMTYALMRAFSSPAVPRYLREAAPVEVPLGPARDVRDVPAPRPLLRVAVGVAGRGLRVPQGHLTADVFPALELRQRGALVSPEAVSAFSQLCAHSPGRDGVPPTFPETLFLRLMAELVADDAFPLSPVGLIHVGQTLTQHRPIAPGERLDLSVKVIGATRTNRGIELRLGLDAASAGTTAWNGVVTLLSRGPSAAPRRPRNEAPPPPPPRALAYARGGSRYRPAVRAGDRRLQPPPPLGLERSAAGVPTAHRTRHVDVGSPPGGER